MSFYAPHTDPVALDSPCPLGKVGIHHRWEPQGSPYKGPLLHQMRRLLICRWCGNIAVQKYKE